jgi:hypothetical protein
MLLSFSIGCGRGPQTEPVKASFVLSKIRYGYSPTAENEIWHFDWDRTPYREILDLFGSTERYRTIGWEREADGGNRVFQTYDLIANRMHRAPAVLFKDGKNIGYQANGWRPAQLEYGQNIQEKGSGLRLGDLQVRLDGSWELITLRWLSDYVSADGPFRVVKYSYQGFSGDVVVFMRDQEILRQRVDKLSYLDLNHKCQVFPGHDLFIYLDGLPSRPGTAWFLDLTLGHPRPIQGPDEIFPGRVNTLPTYSYDDATFIRVDGTDEYAGLKDRADRKHEFDKPYRITVKFTDPDLEYGDALTRYDWDTGSGGIVTTLKPEIIHTFRANDPLQFRQHRINVRAYDRSGKAGPWGVIAVEDLYFQKDVPNVTHAVAVTPQKSHPPAQPK